MSCLSCFSPGRGWVPRWHNWRSIYCGECRIQSIIIKLSCFCTFSYHASKGDCDPDSEHDYCSLHVRLRAGQVTAPSFFKLSLGQFFWWVFQFFEWQTFIGSNSWWELFKWPAFIGSNFWWDVFQWLCWNIFFPSLNRIGFLSDMHHLVCGQLWWATLFMWLHTVTLNLIIIPFLASINVIMKMLILVSFQWHWRQAKKTSGLWSSSW